MDTVKIGEFIKEQRTKLDMTQKDLADKIGCTDKAISRWETGKGMPDVSFLIPLSNELGITLNELLSGEKIVSEDMKKSEELNEIIEKGDEILMEVVKENERSIKRHKKISIALLILFLLQMTLFFVFPNFLPATQDPVEFIVIASVIVFVGVGLINNKLKWLFPILLYGVFFIIDIFSGTWSDFSASAFGLYFLIASFLVIGLTSLAKFSVLKIVERKKR